MPPIKSLKSVNRKIAKLGIKSSKPKLSKNIAISSSQIQALPEINKIVDQEKSGQGSGNFTTNQKINTTEIAKVFNKANEEVLGNVGGINVNNPVFKDAKNKPKDTIQISVRPEIIMLSSFNPLFRSDGITNTEQGDLFDLHVESLRQMDAASISLLKSADQNFIKNKNDKTKIDLQMTKNNLESLINVSNKLKKIEKCFDLNDNINNFLISGFINQVFLQTDDISYQKVLNYGSKCIKNLNFFVVLQNVLGVESSEISKYSSSKLWASMIQELKELFRSHSLDFLIDKKNVTTNNIQQSADPGDLGLSPAPQSSESDIAYGLSYQLTDFRYGKRISTKKIKEIFDTFSEGDNFVFTNNDIFNFQNELTSLVAFELNDLFKTIDQDIFSQVKNDKSKISLTFYLCLKEFFHSKLFENLGVDKDILKRDDFLNSVLGFTHLDQNTPNSVLYNPYNIKNGNRGLPNTSIIEVGYYSSVNPANTVFSFATVAEKDLLETTNINFNIPSIIGSEYFFSSDDIENISDVINFSKLEKYNEFLKSIKENFTNLIKSGIIPDVTSGIITQDFYSQLISKFTDLVDEKGQLFRLKSTKINPSSNDLIYKLDDYGYPNDLSDVQEPQEKDLIAILAFAGSETGEVSKSKKSAKESSYKLLSTLYSCAMQIALIMNKSIMSSDEVSSFSIDELKVESLYPIANKISSIFEEMLINDYNLAGAPHKTINFQPIKNYRVSANTQPIAGMLLMSSKSGYMQKIAGNLALLLENGLEYLCPIYFYSFCKFISNTTSYYINSINVNVIPPNEQIQFAQTEVFLTCMLDPTKFNLARNCVNVVHSDVDNEIKKLFISSASIFTFLNNVSNRISELSSYINVEKFFNYFLKYLNGDVRKVGFLFKNPQLFLSHSYVEDLLLSFKSFEKTQTNDSFLKNVQGFSHSKKVVDLIKSEFSKEDYTHRKGYNKKIISVGIPQGLIKSIFQNYSINETNSLNLKKNDIIKIMIYKVDIMNGLIRYKPKEFIFEISRFPIRSNQSLSIFSDISRNYYFSAEDNVFNFNIETSFSSFGNEYSFLSNEDKLRILNNHKISFILENYIKIISGLNVEESTFALFTDEELEPFYKNLITDQTSEIIEQISKNSQEEINKYKNTSIEQVFNIASVAIPNSDAIISRIVHPKKYDRVFNIIFDPDDFIIDEKESDKDVLGTLKQNKKVVLKGNYPDLYFVDKDKQFYDASFDSFFVSVQLNEELDNDLINFEDIKKIIPQLKKINI